MDVTTLQVPLSKNLKANAAAVAKEFGFSSLQEIVRILLTKLAKRELQLTVSDRMPKPCLNPPGCLALNIFLTNGVKFLTIEVWLLVDLWCFAMNSSIMSSTEGSSADLFFSPPETMSASCHFLIITGSSMSLKAFPITLPSP